MRSLLFAALACVTACQLPGPDTSSTEQALTGVGFTPVSGQDLGSIQVGSSSADLSVRVYPTGTGAGTYVITSITGCSDFPVNAPNLPAEVSRTCVEYCEPAVCAAPICAMWEVVTYDFTTAFQPAVAGASSCALQLQITGLGQKTYTVSGTGTLPPIDIDVSPGALDFGDVRRNTASSDATVMVTNVGGQPLDVTSASVSAGYTITSGPASTTIGVSGAQPYNITCNPTATGPMPGTFTVTSNDPDMPTVNVALACNGIDSNLNVVPSPASVGITRVGEPTTRSISLGNTGGASMTIQSATLTGAGLTATGLPLPNATIGPGGSVNATIRFDAATAGDASGTLTVVFDGGQMRSVPVTAKALTTSMSLTPDGTIDFGPVCVGQSDTRSVSVAANAEGSFKLTSISSPGAPFTVGSAPLPATIQGSGANKETLTLMASPMDVGPATATVTVRTDIPGAQPRTLDLAVTGLTAGVSATPAELDLGPSAVGKATLGQEVSVTNCSTSPAQLSNARIEGANAADFAIVQAPSLMLGPNETVSWLVIANPQAVGQKLASFLVDGPQGTSEVKLYADGIGDPGGSDPGGGSGRASYYACSTGTGAGSLPIGLALAALLVRRRRRTA